MTWIAHNKLLFLGIVVLIVGGIWFGLSSSSAPVTEPLTAVSPTSTGSPTQDSADQQLVASLLALKSVTLSGTIFQDPAFLALKDFSTTIVAEPVGRANPFAPLGVDTGSVPIGTSTLPATGGATSAD